jgi:hypothetical protein
MFGESALVHGHLYKYTGNKIPSTVKVGLKVRNFGKII